MIFARLRLFTKINHFCFQGSLSEEAVECIPTLIKLPARHHGQLLAQMRNLPINELKIDRAFVQPLATSSVDQSIVSSTIRLAHELNLSVVAEGVEDEQSWRILQQTGCDVLQGYYFSKPIALAEFRQRLEEQGYDS